MTDTLDQAIAAACARIAPLWPLSHFVAVNPFLGFAGKRFGETCAAFRRIAGVNILMPRAFYRDAMAAGAITDADLQYALDAMEGGLDLDCLKRRIARDPVPVQARRAVVATVAQVLDQRAEGDRHVSRVGFMIDEISRFCAAYFDEGQASWKLPGAALPLYPAWRAAMRYDRNAEAMGIKGFRAAVAAMPADPRAAIETVVAALGIPHAALTDYLHRALFDIGGWAAYVRYLQWDNALYGRADDRLTHLLAIRVVWGYALFRQQTDPGFQEAWSAAMRDAASLPSTEQIDPDLMIDLILQRAFEAAYQRRLIADLAAARSGPAAAADVQAAFCIDVRSEVFRRALESVSPEVDTIGFAGFFGYPIEYVPIGQTHGGAQCPVLLKPAFTVCEAVAGASAEESDEIMGLRQLRRRAAKAWKAFKLSAVSSFTYVETCGPAFAVKIGLDSLGLTRPVPHPHLDGLDKDAIARTGPTLTPAIIGGRATGFTLDQRLTQAEAVLRAMSLTRDFAPIVLLAGHGSTTVNNPHASGLDCGACGGHTGEANARVAAEILNDQAVREGLAARGIDIPAATWFVGGLHDTTTDDVRLFDADAPAAAMASLARLKTWLSEAGHRARRERAARMGVDPAKADRALRARSRDWSRVRPEWGLAGNAAFIAAPRARTKGVDLLGRVFLHDYHHRLDDGYRVLDLIMTAPMIVASWINLQYLASSVDNKVFGAGNKVLHNVTGTLGVLEGNGGDLQAGLPWQSVHDGTSLAHDPLRLAVFIEAPREQLTRVLARHQAPRELVENEWIFLFAIDDDGGIFRYAPKGAWVPEGKS